MAFSPSIAGRLALMVALAGAMAGAVIGGILLHDWVFATPSPQVAEVAPSPAEIAPAAPDPSPEAEMVETKPVSPSHPAPGPATESTTWVQTTDQTTINAPIDSQESPVDLAAMLPSQPTAPMPLPYSQAGPETPPAVLTFEVTALPPAAMSANWLRQAVPTVVPAGRPMIAVVIDDVGVNNPRNTARVVALPAPLTLALMSYAPNAAELAASARSAGHELLVHLPMEPEDGTLSTGPNAMRTDLSDAELRQRLQWALTRFEGYVGISNHMGSEFTASEAGMSVVLQEVHDRGLLFLDSKTTAASVGPAVASRLGLPFAERDVFLDNETTVGAVWDQLSHLEDVARRKGYAIAIGHPHDGTLDALAAWLPTVEQRGFVLVPISMIVHRNLAKTAATN
ncbi:MAG: divergent polysaccharide deacetylase family protein [Dongiaceae bacterium]